MKETLDLCKAIAQDVKTFSEELDEKYKAQGFTISIADQIWVHHDVMGRIMFYPSDFMDEKANKPKDILIYNLDKDD